MANATSGRLAPCGSLYIAIPRTIHGVSGAGSRVMIPGVANGVPITKAPFSVGVQAQGFSGNYKVAGTTTDNGVPVARWVYLFPQAAPSLLIASAFTPASTGAFLFTGLAAGNYIVMGVDPSGTNNAVVYDFVAAVSM